METTIANPLLSFIIPTYNSSAHLPSCLDSLLSQTFDDFEVIAVDGGSTDDTIACLEERKLADPRVRFISERDNGIYDAMNKGIKLAKGTWLFFLGSDDHLSSSDVLHRVRLQLRSPFALVYGDVRIRGNVPWAKDGQIYDGEFTRNKLSEKNISHQCIFYHRSIFDRFGSYDTRLKVCADWAFNVTIFRHCRSQHVDVVVADFHAGGLSSRQDDPEINAVLFELVMDHLRPSPLHRYYKSHLDEIERLARRKRQAREWRKCLRYTFLWSLHAPVTARVIYAVKQRLAKVAFTFRLPSRRH